MYTYVHYTEDSRPFRSSAISFPGAKRPKRELLLPWNFRSVEHLLLGTVAPVELSFLGSEDSKNFRCVTFAPVELSFLGSERSKNFHSYETVVS